MRRAQLITLAALLFAGSAFAGDKKLMHCFAFTPVATANDADWNAFFRATDQLSEKIPGITHIWYGKLRRDLTIMAPAEDSITPEAEAKGVKPRFERVARKFGVCMEMDDEGVLTRYTNDPAHKVWLEAYAKVRVEGTTTFDIFGQ